MAKDEDMITNVGELIGVIGLMDDGPPYRLTTVISYGRSRHIVCLQIHLSPCLFRTIRPC